MPSVTLDRLLADKLTLAVDCTAPGCLALQKLRRHFGGCLHPSELIARHGLDPATTLDELRPRLRCEVCGARGHAVLEVTGYGPPPMGFGAVDHWSSERPGGAVAANERRSASDGREKD